MQNETATRVVIYATIGLLVAYDIVCAVKGWKTITSQVRWLNDQTGWLVAIGWAGLWLHFFFAQSTEWAARFLATIAGR